MTSRRQAARSTFWRCVELLAGEGRGQSIRCRRSEGSSRSEFPCPGRGRGHGRRSISGRACFRRSRARGSLPFSSLRNQLTWKTRGVAESVALHLEPVTEVVAHVVAAEGQHGHGIAADLADSAGCGRGGFRAHGGADVDAGCPVEGLVDERDVSARRPPKMMAEMGTPSGYSHAGVDDWGIARRAR